MRNFEDNSNNLRVSFSGRVAKGKTRMNKNIYAGFEILLYSYCLFVFNFVGVVSAFLHPWWQKSL